MIILQKINNFSEITSRDCKSKQFWLLQCNGDRYFFNNPNGEFTKDLYEKFQNSIYWYSPAEFEFNCSFNNLSHDDSPAGISGEFSIAAKLLPSGVGFANWIISTKIEELTVDEIKVYFQERPHILRSFIQRVLTDKSLDELIKNQGEVLDFHSANDLSWLIVTTVRIKHLSQEISDVQKRVNSYNAWVAEQEEKLQYAQQQLEYEVSWANIEEAHKEIARRSELEAIAHDHKIAQAKCEHELQQLQYQLDEKHKKELADFQEAEIKASIEKLQLEIDKYKLDIELAENRIKKQNAQIKLIEIKSATEAINLETAGLQKAKAEEELNKLKLAQEYYCNEIKTSQQIEEQLLAIKEMITQGNTEIRNILAEMLHHFDKKIEETFQNYSEWMNRPYSQHSSLSIIDVVRKQSKNNKVILVKESANNVNSFVKCRDISLPVKYSTVKLGSSIKFSFESNIEGFVTIICFGTSGDVQLLEPNFIDHFPKIAAGKKYSFPGDNFLSIYQDLTQTGHVGTEKLLIIVSQNSLKDIFYDLNFDDEAFDSLTEYQLDLLTKKLESQSPDSWAAGYLAYQVTAK